MKYDNYKLMTPEDEGCAMVSSCCGSLYVDSIEKENDIETIEDYVCCKCQNYCDIIEDYEYTAIQRENYFEDMRD